MKQTFGEKLLMETKLNREIVPGMPFAEIYGNSRVYIENHRGVSYFSDLEVILSSKIGEIRIEGHHLEIAMISDSDLLITGNITELIWEGHQ